MYSLYPERPDLCDIAMLVVKEDHSLVGDAGVLPDSVEMRDLAARIDFLVVKVVSDFQHIEKLPGPLRLPGSRSHSERVPPGGEIIENPLQVRVEPDVTAVTICHFSTCTRKRWIQVITPGSSRIPDGEVEVENY